jgi:ABC-2 type transport system permease protein
MLNRIFNMIFKELIQFRRDWVLAAFIILAPALQLVLMARVTEQGVKEQPVVILDQDRTQMSRRLAMSLENTEELRVKGYVESPEEMRDSLDGGQARLAVIIPEGFARGLASANSSESIQILADGSNSVAAATAISAASGAVSRFASRLVDGESGIELQFIDFRTEVRFNPALDYQDFSIPAQLGFLTYQVTLAVAAIGLARERELGTLEQLLVTPLRRIELALGKGVPAITIGGVNFAVMWAISIARFHVPMNGSILLLFALTLLFVATVVNWGLVISSISRTQQQAILFVFILAMMEITFSGFMVPVNNMPAFLQVISRFAPLQHYLVIIRSIMLKGAGLDVLWPQTLALVALSLMMGAISLRTFAGQIE